MNNRIRTISPRNWKAGLILVWVMALCLVGQVSANPAQQTAGSGGLGVDGALLLLEAEPGQTYTHKMIVSIGSGAQPTEINVEAAGFGQTLGGSFEPLPAQEDLSPYSARLFITKISNPKFRLEPGQSMEVDATLEIPSNFTRDTHYAIIYIYTNPVFGSDDNAIGQILAVSIPVIITPPDVVMNQSGQISGLVVEPVESGKPIRVLTTVKNTGNRHFKIQGKINLLDPDGNQVAELTIPLTATSIFPTFSRTVEAVYNALEHPQGLKPGTYTADVQILREDGSMVEEKRLPFEINERYNPFPDIAEEDLLIVNFENEQPGTIDAVEIAGVKIRFEDTGAVTGSVAIGLYRQHPPGKPAFGDPRGEGGAEAKALRYVGVKVSGFNEGTSHFTFYYTQNELDGVAANSLFLANRKVGFWQKLRNLEVQTGSEIVLGDLGVAELEEGTIVALGGQEITESGFMEVLRQNLDIALMVGVSVLLLAGVFIVVTKSRRPAPKNAPK
ncbi:MAG: hypothetical protein AB1453_13835 [Chloroflexota bacterium]